MKLTRRGSHVRRWLAILGFTALMVAGCSTQGRPTPTPPSSQDGLPSQVAASSSASTPGQSGAALPVDHPCSLLSPSDLRQVGVSVQPTEGMVGTAHECEFDSNDFSIDVGLRTNVGLADFQAAGGTVENTTIGSHQAKEAADSGGSCVVALGVSASSRVDVTVTPIGTSDPCPTALNLAKLVEPKLP